MGPVGWPEMVIIFLVALVLFGPKKLPELGRTIGKAITEFRRASNDLRSTFEREMQTMEKESREIQDVTRQYVNDVTQIYDPPSYESSQYYDSYNDYGQDPASVSNQSTVGASATQGAEPSAEATPAGVEGTISRESAASPEVDLAENKPAEENAVGGKQGA
jgi:sec-independent protein translocase protein TatA